MALAEHLAAGHLPPGDEILYAWRSFEAYPIIAASGRRDSVRVPNTADHGHDLPAMAAAITDRTRLILVCNPNNPTGTAVRHAELDAFLDAVPADVLVVLDEAYREFVTDPDVPDGLADYGDRPNVVVLRTLSKAWGLAGLRVGFLVAQPEVAAPSARWSRRSPPTWPPRPPRSPRWSGGRDAPPRRAGGRGAGPGAEAVRKRMPDVPETQANFIWLPLPTRPPRSPPHARRAA